MWDEKQSLVSVSKLLCNKNPWLELKGSQQPMWDKKQSLGQCKLLNNPWLELKVKNIVTHGLRSH